MFCQNCGKQISDGSTFCEECGAPQGAVTQPIQPTAPFITEKQKKKKTALWVILGIIAFIVIIAIATGGGDKGDSTVYPIAPPTENAASEPEQTTSAAADNSVDVTMGQKNALRSAKEYIGSMPFSHDGLVKQLEYEGYSHEDSVYGADNCAADWNEQAAKSAEAYLGSMSFSREGLIEQLVYEGFTSEQAAYGAEANGY